jgi:hypothetical protein
MPAYWIKSGEAKEIEINWEYGYGELSSGKYRILKGIGIEKETESYDDSVVAFEFTIE